MGLSRHPPPPSGSKTPAVMGEYDHFKMKNGSRAKRHLINADPRGREGAAAAACGGGTAPGLVSAEGTDERLKRAETHLCRRKDGDPSQRGGYKEAVSAGEVLNAAIHHATTILQTPPS